VWLLSKSETSSGGVRWGLACWHDHQQRPYPGSCLHRLPSACRLLQHVAVTVMQLLVYTQEAGYIGMCSHSVFSCMLKLWRQKCAVLCSVA
jgi:hypothetical protein